MKILALDLGKYKSVGCTYDTVTLSEKYDTIATRPQEVHDLILESAADRLVIEVGTPAGWIYDLAQALEVECQVANPNDERWSWRKVTTKTDRKDALKLATLSAIDQLPTVTVPPMADRQLRSLTRYRSKLIHRRTDIQNSIRAIFDAQGIAIPVGAKAWTIAARELLSSYAQPLDEVDVEQYWRGMLRSELTGYDAVQTQLKAVNHALESRAKTCSSTIRLRTIPGVGQHLAEVLVAVIGDPKRFKSAKHVSSYVGLTPRLHQSGTMTRSGRISKRGDRALRSLLVEVAWVSQRYNPTFKHLFNHLVGGSVTRRKKAVVALARRILVIAWSMLKHGTDWDASKVGSGLGPSSPAPA